MLAHSSSLFKNGFSISSLPSIGDIIVRSVPRATTSPSGLVSSLPSSSVLQSALRCSRSGFHVLRTSHELLHLIQHQIHQLIEAL